MLGIEPRASHMLAKHPNTEIHLEKRLGDWPDGKKESRLSPKFFGTGSMKKRHELQTVCSEKESSLNEE
jgi:hypothetical protein